MPLHNSSACSSVIAQSLLFISWVFQIDKKSPCPAHPGKLNGKGKNIMLVIAKSVKGKEFLYNAESARKVSKRSASAILSVLNEMKWRLSDNEVWHIHEVDEYDNAYYYAQRQAFTIRNGIVSAKCY